MKSFIFLFIVTIFIMAIPSNAQDQETSKTSNDSKLPYHQIPDYPDSYTPGNVAARVVDGLGFRYYWATESLREEDLGYKPSEDSRTTRETIDHIYGLSKFILSAPKDKANEELTFEQIRKKTLENFQQASKQLKESKEDDLDVLVENFPYWNMLNGPISDAIYHTGQVVAYRRASGNPIHSGVSVFSGKTKK
jgi:hypothetical protein